MIISADLAIRQEWRRVNTAQNTFPGDEVAPHVMASHSTHLPSVHDMAHAMFLPRRLETPSLTNRREKIIPTSDLCYNPYVIDIATAQRRVSLRQDEWALHGELCRLFSQNKCKWGPS